MKTSGSTTRESAAIGSCMCTSKEEAESESNNGQPLHPPGGVNGGGGGGDDRDDDCGAVRQRRDDAQTHIHVNSSPNWHSKQLEPHRQQPLGGMNGTYGTAASPWLGH